MRVLKAVVEWNEHLLNSPRLQVLVDELPQKGFVYRSHKVGNNTLWFAEKDGEVSFFSEVPGNHRGFGGNTFTIQTENGPYELVGPWSSRAGCMNRYFEPQCVDVDITDDPDAWERGRTFYSGAITLEKAREACALIGGVEMVRADKYGDIRWEPRRNAQGDR